jgi:WD40 repeat protein
MQIYNSNADHVWAVASIGNQVAALAPTGVLVWNRNEPEPAQTLLGKFHGHKSLLAGSVNGQWLLTTNHDLLKCWQSARAGWQLQFEESRPRFCTAIFAPDGQALSIVDLSDIRDGAVNFTLTERRLSPKGARPGERLAASFLASPSAVAADGNLLSRYWHATDLSVDGKWFLVSAREKAVHVWQAVEGRYIGAVKLRGITNEAKFSPDGSRFAVDGGTTVYVFQTATLELLSSWKIKHCYHPHIAWSPDGRLLARTDISTTLRIQDVDGGTEALAISAREYGRLSSAAFAPDGLTILVGTNNGFVIVWDVDK